MVNKFLTSLRQSALGSLAFASIMVAAPVAQAIEIGGPSGGVDMTTGHGKKLHDSIGALIIDRIPASTSDSVCTATIIGETWAITATHCFDNTGWPNPTIISFTPGRGPMETPSNGFPLPPNYPTYSVVRTIRGPYTPGVLNLRELTLVEFYPPVTEDNYIPISQDDINIGDFAYLAGGGMGGSGGSPQAIKINRVATSVVFGKLSTPGIAPTFATGYTPPGATEPCYLNHPLPSTTPTPNEGWGRPSDSGSVIAIPKPTYPYNLEAHGITQNATYNNPYARCTIATNLFLAREWINQYVPIPPVVEPPPPPPPPPPANNGGGNGSPPPSSSSDESNDENIAPPTAAPSASGDVVGTGRFGSPTIMPPTGMDDYQIPHTTNPPAPPTLPTAPLPGDTKDEVRRVPPATTSPQIVPVLPKASPAGKAEDEIRFVPPVTSPPKKTDGNREPLSPATDAPLPTLSIMNETPAGKYEGKVKYPSRIDASTGTGKKPAPIATSTPGDEGKMKPKLSSAINITIDQKAEPVLVIDPPADEDETAPPPVFGSPDPFAIPPRANPAQ